jgi:hypothetical protein
MEATSFSDITISLYLTTLTSNLFIKVLLAGLLMYEYLFPIYLSITYTETRLYWHFITAVL